MKIHHVIDNFLDEKVFSDLKAIMFGDDIEWHWLNNMTGKDSYFLYHNFYSYSEPKSSYYHNFFPYILTKLNYLSVVNIRANLMLKKEVVYKSEYHTDQQAESCKTAILYMNNCNGYTNIKTDKLINKIDCKENRIVIFDSQLEHQAISQTDTERRIVINFNFFSK